MRRRAQDGGPVSYDAVVLAGGAARRLGGRDKPALMVGGRTLLDRAVEACAGARRVVVVGPERTTARPVTWVREDPPGGGPVAALAAGLAAVDAPHVVVLAADLPFVTRAVTEALVAALGDTTAKTEPPDTPDNDAGGATGDVTTARDDEPRGMPGDAARGGADGGTRGDGALLVDADNDAGGATGDVTTARDDEPRGMPGDGALLVDADGRDQPLLAAYRTASLRSALAAVGDPHGAALRRLVAPLTLIRLPDPTRAAFDCDTWPQVRVARVRSGRMEDVLEEWIEAVKAELGVELDVDVAALLDMTKVAAHNVVRPAAPLTAFLVGYAAARSGGGEEAVADALRKAEALAAAYERPDPEAQR